MTRKIFRSVSLTSVLAVALATVLIAWYIYGIYEKQLTDELRAEAGYIAHALSRETDETAFFDGFPSENRVSLISPDGLVLYDSGADASGLGDHSDRPEVLSALNTGRGESRRYSGNRRGVCGKTAGNRSKTSAAQNRQVRADSGMERRF